MQKGSIASKESSMQFPGLPTPATVQHCTRNQIDAKNSTKYCPVSFAIVKAEGKMKSSDNEKLLQRNLAAVTVHEDRQMTRQLFIQTHLNTEANHFGFFSIYSL